MGAQIEVPTPDAAASRSRCPRAAARASCCASAATARRGRRARAGRPARAARPRGAAEALARPGRTRWRSSPRSTAPATCGRRSSREHPSRHRDTPKYMIGVAAELVGMHPQTLRVYETRGLDHAAPHRRRHAPLLRAPTSRGCGAITELPSGLGSRCRAPSTCSGWRQRRRARWSGATATWRPSWRRGDERHRARSGREARAAPGARSSLRRGAAAPPWRTATAPLAPSRTRRRGVIDRWTSQAHRQSAQEAVPGRRRARPGRGNPALSRAAPAARPRRGPRRASSSRCCRAPASTRARCAPPPRPRWRRCPRCAAPRPPAAQPA